MMADTQELANFGMFALGIDPEKSTRGRLEEGRRPAQGAEGAGIVRNYYDQNYIDALAKGDVWITMAWSGDIFQQNVSDGTNLKFVDPGGGRHDLDRQHE